MMRCVTYLNAFIKIYLYWFYTLNKIGGGQVKETHLKKIGFISVLDSFTDIVQELNKF